MSANVVAPALAAPVFATVDHALEQLRAGRPVIVVDDAAEDSEGDLILAAAHATPELMAFMIRHGSGFVCVALDEADLERLALPQMVKTHTEGTDFAITVDARSGTTSGISAADRAQTCRVLADPSSVPADLDRPGHVFPLRAVAGGVLRRTGHAESAVDLVRLSGAHSPAGVISHIINPDGTVSRLAELIRFAAEHGLALVSVADLIRHRLQRERQVELLPAIDMPTRHGVLKAIGCRSLVDQSEHLALVAGDIGDGEDVLVRVQSECQLGHVFRSTLCTCGPQLDRALAEVVREGRGVVVHIRSRERGGPPGVSGDCRAGSDPRDYGTGAQILRELGVRTIRLLSNHPMRRSAIDGYGLAIVEHVSLGHVDGVRH